MKELQNSKKWKAPSKANDAAGLNSLLGFLNNPAVTGAVVPKGAVTKTAIEPAESAEPSGAVTITEAPIVEKQPTPPQPAAPAPTTAPSLSRVFLTGRFKVGKDHIAALAGCKIFAVADPLYFLAEFFFGKQPKDAGRSFLQKAGQWGRGTVSAEYPLTPERAMFVKFIRETFSSELKVDWHSYGRSENIWLDSLVARAAEEPAEMKIAVSGVRFENELRRLTTEGFIHRHVLCSAATWADRLKKVGMTPESPACRDVSEHLAAAFDADVTRKLSQQKAGAKLAAVWCDERVSSPSTRLLTVAEFVAQFPR